LYNYTALLTGFNLEKKIVLIQRLFYLGALFQTKIDIERLYDKHSLYSSTYSNQNSVVSRTSRLLFVLLGIILVALIFGLTVMFFQRMYVYTIEEIFRLFSILFLVVGIVIQNYLKLHEYVKMNH
jgi:hypothetical protein